MPIAFSQKKRNLTKVNWDHLAPKSLCLFIRLMIVLMILMGLTNCKKETVQLDENFVKLYSELRLATISNHYQKNRAAKIRKIILEKYGWTARQYSDNLFTLKQHPESWHQFQESIIKTIEELENNHKK